MEWKLPSGCLARVCRSKRARTAGAGKATNHQGHKRDPAELGLCCGPRPPLLSTSLGPGLSLSLALVWGRKPLFHAHTCFIPASSGCSLVTSLKELPSPGKICVVGSLWFREQASPQRKPPFKGCVEILTALPPCSLLELTEALQGFSQWLLYQSQGSRCCYSLFYGWGN